MKHPFFTSRSEYLEKTKPKTKQIQNKPAKGYMKNRNGGVMECIDDLKSDAQSLLTATEDAAGKKVIAARNRLAGALDAAIETRSWWLAGGYPWKFLFLPGLRTSGSRQSNCKTPDSAG